MHHKNVVVRKRRTRCSQVFLRFGDLNFELWMEKHQGHPDEHGERGDCISVMFWLVNTQNTAFVLTYTGVPSLRPSCDHVRAI